MNLQELALRILQRNGFSNATPAAEAVEQSADIEQRVTEGSAERVARLDAERNEADRRARRGYDYDGQPRALIPISPHISFGIVDDFGACEVCGEPTALITPQQHRFCGITCYQSVAPRETRHRTDKRPLRAQLDRIEELRRYLRQPLDDEDLSRPHVTAGPYCPWPQAGFGRRGKR